MKDFIKDISIILVVFILGLAIGFEAGRYEDNVEQHFMKDSTDNFFLNEESLKVCLDTNKVKFSHIVLAQAKLESNYFKSKLAKTNNNLFGMRVAATRFTFAVNKHDFSNYAKYQSVGDCVLDYSSWQVQNAYNITNEEAYYALLAKYYAEDPGYVNKLKKIVNENSNN